MTDDPQTGPWILALGALAIGVGAVATELLRRRHRDPEDEGARRGSRSPVGGDDGREDEVAHSDPR